MKREQKYHGKVKSLIDGLRDSRGKPWKGFSQLIEKVAVRPEEFIDPYPNTTLASTVMLQGVTDDANQKKVAVEKLKALYGWADESLIEDVLVAVNYELEQASASLESMAVMTLPENSDPSDASEAVENSLPDQSSEGSGPLLPESLGFQNLHVTVSRGHMPTAPPETEWEDSDDVYLKHRKEALWMLRSITGSIELLCWILRCTDGWSSRHFFWYLNS